MTTNAKTLALDLRIYSADERLRRNLLAVRSAITQDLGMIAERTLSVPPDSTMIVSEIVGTVGVVLYSKYPITVTTQIEANVPVTMTNQTMFVTTTQVRSLTLYNPGTKTSVVTIIRLANSGDALDYTIPRHLITFPMLSRIAPIGYTVTDLAKVEVEDVALFNLTNDQVTAPSNVAGQKFRVCDVSGTPNPNGAYLMYLNDVVTQQNFTGTLQVWVQQRA